MPLTSKQKLAQYDAAQRVNQRALLRVSQRGGAARMKALYDKAQAELAAKLRREVRRGRGDSYTADKHRVAMAMIRQGQAKLTTRLTSELGEVSQEAATDGLHTANETLSKLSRDFDAVDVVLPTEEASVFAGVLGKRRASLLRQHEELLRNYGGRVVSLMEEQLALSLAQEETPLQAIDRVQQVADVNWWQGERIVRSECSYAFNLAHHDAYKEAQREIPDLWMRWSEHCSDEDGEPLDDRVSERDSVFMHGQCVPAGGLFKLPQTANGEASPKMMLEQWAAPPKGPTTELYSSRGARIGVYRDTNSLAGYPTGSCPSGAAARVDRASLRDDELDELLTNF